MGFVLKGALGAAVDAESGTTVVLVSRYKDITINQTVATMRDGPKFEFDVYFDVKGDAYDPTGPTILLRAGGIDDALRKAGMLDNATDSRFVLH